MNVLHHHHRIVDHQADGDGEAAHRHQVDRSAEQAQEHERRNHRHRQRDRGDQRQPEVAQEDDQHDDREKAADENRVAHVGDRGGDELGEVVDLGDRESGGQRVREVAERLLDAGLQVEDVRADLLGDADRHRVAAVAGDEQRAIGRAGARPFRDRRRASSRRP